jgi:hypothetical protein
MSVAWKGRQSCARFGSWVSVSAPCRDTALHYASYNGHTESVRALLEKGAAVNAENNTKCAFGDGCRRRQRPCGRFGLWVSVSAPCRDTALHDASCNGHTESVRALLEKGADVNAENNTKCAFGDGCRRRQRPCGRFGLWVSVSAPCRNTALHDASRSGDTESVKALLKKGADANAKNNYYKCAFSCVLVLDGRRLLAPAKAVRPIRLVGERAGAMQGYGTSSRI